MEITRTAELALNSLALAAIACFVAVPLGLLLATSLSCFRIAGARVAWFLVLLAFCWPLPVTALAWQIILGSWLPPLRLNPGEIAWRPWSQGLLPAGIIHGFAAWPWVTALATALLSRSHQTLEEQATLETTPWMAFRRLHAGKLKLASLLSICWVTLQTFTEIPITDAMMVRSFAEEIYTQLVGGVGNLGAALRGVLPPMLCIVGCGLTLIVRMQRLTHANESEVNFQRSQHAKTSHWATVVVFSILVLLVIVPVLALLFRAGGSATVEGFQFQRLSAEVLRVVRGEGLLLVQSLVEALVAASLLAFLAWAACWWALRSRAFAMILAVVCVILAATPGPLLGLALKEIFLMLIQCEIELLRLLDVTIDFPPMRSMLYDQPTPVPAFCAGGLRYFPLAVLLFLPAFRAIPKGLWEAAAVDGLTLRARLRSVVLPSTEATFRWCIPALAILLMGEVSATKIVNPPFRPAYILRLFDMMHYGAETTVAVLALGQVLAAAVVCALLQSEVTSLARVWRGSQT